MTLEALDKHSTLIKIKESGWKENQESLDEYYSHCKGWNAKCYAALKFMWITGGT